MSDIVCARCGQSPCACGNLVGIDPTERIISLLDSINNSLEVLDPRGGSDTDQDYLWSIMAPLTPGWPQAAGTDWALVGTTRYWHSEDAANMVPIDLPNGRKFPYAMIQGGARSLELIDDVTGLPVLVAGPGQIVTGCIGVSSSYRAIIGPGMTNERVAVRFSTRPLNIPPNGQTSGPIRVLPPNHTITASGSSFFWYGWWRNPSGARALIVYVNGTTPGGENISLNLIGPPENPGNVFADGVPILNQTPGAGDFRFRRAVRPNAPGIGVSGVPVHPSDTPARQFGFSLQMGPGAGAVTNFNIWYELVY